YRLSSMSGAVVPTLNASSMSVASSRSLEIKFRPMLPATISSSVGGTEFKEIYHPTVVKPKCTAWELSCICISCEGQSI
ncbi:hypothetical protein RJ641_035623, partial [Dillenia turbinata]